ncbi:hypothetical protein H1D32_13170 [Anaerobacillus sp. CMMVII]|uniref:hypothetical protein n=1 Tax=Anaerobacillus sp. CMMVII TaxID=2755588 RepID=UPI0021B7904D|nr:hypothetical protein [Anaerobacillus sp. CMMVII]MCT8138607.1 hypothetical protein [Anaerobacillus sp. CMMVII]
MRKTVADRVAYYVRKIAEKGAIHPAEKQPRSYKYRQQRLMAYKESMHKQINDHHNCISTALKGK